MAALRCCHRGPSTCSRCTFSYDNSVSISNRAVRYTKGGRRNRRALGDSFSGSYGSSFTGVSLSLGQRGFGRAYSDVLFGRGLPVTFRSKGDDFSLGGGSDGTVTVRAKVNRKGALISPLRVTLVTDTISRSKVLVHPCLISRVRGSSKIRMDDGGPGACTALVARARTNLLRRCVHTIIASKAKEGLSKRSCRTSNGAKATRMSSASSRAGT